MRLRLPSTHSESAAKMKGKRMTKEEIEKLRAFATKRTKMLYFPCKKTANALLRTLGTVEGLQQRVAELEDQKERTNTVLTRIRETAMLDYRRGLGRLKPILVDIDEIKNKIINRR